MQKLSLIADTLKINLDNEKSAIEIIKLRSELDALTAFLINNAQTEGDKIQTERAVKALRASARAGITSVLNQLANKSKEDFLMGLLKDVTVEKAK